MGKNERFKIDTIWSKLNRSESPIKERYSLYGKFPVSDSPPPLIQELQTQFL